MEQYGTFLNDLKDEDIAAAAAVLPGLDSFISSLKLKKKRFDLALHHWEESKTENKLSESATSIKKRILSTVNRKVITYLKAMMVVDAPKYNPQPTRSCG